MPRIRNIDAYIEHKVQKELDKTLIGMIDRRIKQFNIHTITSRHQSQTLKDFTQATLGGGLRHLLNFGTTDSQFMNRFATEVRRAVIRGL